MLIFAWVPSAPPASHPPHPALALALPLLLVLLLLAEVISHAIRARRVTLHSSPPLHQQEDAHRPLLVQPQPLEPSSEHDARTEAKRTVLELIKVLLGAGLLGVCLMKVVGRPMGAWEGVLDGGVAGVAVYIAVVSFASLVWSEWAQAVRRQQIVLFGALVVVLGLKDLIPFIYVQHPNLSLSTTLGFLQLSLSFLLLLTLLLTPPHFTPLSHNTSPPNPAQLASPLSRLFFSWNESRMWGWYRRSGKAADHEFLEFVPPLPDYLRAGWVLGLFRWKGDEVREAEEVEDERKGEGQEETPSGAVREFIWAFRWELVKILGFAVVWIVAIFLSPLSMNLLLSYVQDNTDTRVSPYLFVLGIFLAPIVSSVAYQNAVYRLGQIGLRLRALLGHAVYKKLLRVKAGGGGTKDDDGEEGAEPKKGPGGGAEAVGRVNNLVGTDIDVITSSLTISLQLFGVPPKLIVSLVFLYFLLGWSAFVALAAILAFAPISTVVSKKYGGAQEQIMQATDKRITVVGELVAAIRIIKMFSWEKSSMDKIYQARQTELDRIVQRAKVYAGMMFLSTGVPVVVTLTTFAAYIFGMKQPLTASTAFTSMALFGLLREAVISSTYLLSSFMRARVSLGRITRFIADTEELDSAPRTFEGDRIEIKEGKFRFSRFGSKGFTLDIDELKVPVGKTTIIAGDVGSGKSALLSALLGEMHKRSGEVKYPARVSTSFAAQSPWLQDDTVKANVLFGEKYDEERYHKTLHACALESDLDGFPDGDQTRVGEKGLSMSGGQKQRIALARAVYAHSDIVLLDDVLSAVDSNTAAHIVEHCLSDLLKDRTVVLVTHFVKMCTRGIEACELVVRLKDGKIEKQGPPETHLSPNSSRMLRTSSSHSSLMSRKSSSPKKEETEPVEHHHEESPGGASISFKVYQRYFSAMGGWAFWLGYAAVNLTAHVLMLSQGWWVGRWVNAGDRDAHSSFYFTIYACIQLASSVSLTAMYLSLIFGAVKASRKLHQRLTQSIFGAPFRFFDVTPHGALLNRFSKDTEILDTEQVENLQPVLDYSVQVLFVAIIISVILPIFLLPAALISAVFFFIGRLYIRNALAARKQVAEARSPLFSTLGDTTSGVVTIRAFKREKHFSTTYLEKTDRYNQMQLYEEGLDRWLEERSDIVGATVSFIVGLLALRAGIDSGTTGFLVSTGLEFTSRILYVVRAVNKNALSLNSVQRIFAYSDIEQEQAGSEKGKPPASWPQGKIEFDDYSAKYSEDGPDVLHNLSFAVEQGAKIGIVGPSGCGKSSLSLALLRFIIPSNGTISIDGRTVDSTNLEALRSRITLIPQDPTLFSGTLRSNLDPNDEYDDAVLWQAVQRSGFAKQGEQGSEGAKGVSLDTVVQSGGSNFSQGQRQLLSLARALIILDEATASLDNESDATMQKVIKEEFDDCTNITIAHRLESVIGFDKVLVLDAGRILEFDTPRKLLESTESRFYELCEATGNLDVLQEMGK